MEVRPDLRFMGEREVAGPSDEVCNHEMRETLRIVTSPTTGVARQWDENLFTEVAFGRGIAGCEERHKCVERRSRFARRHPCALIARFALAQAVIAYRACRR